MAANNNDNTKQSQKTDRDVSIPLLGAGVSLKPSGTRQGPIGAGWLQPGGAGGFRAGKTFS